MARWRILCYHSVDPAEARAFARQLDLFPAAGYRFCSFGEGLRRLREGRDGTWVTVSFDDADWTVSAQARNYLEERGIRAMLYLTTEYVLRGRYYPHPRGRPALTWEQVGRWLEAGHEVGSHTHTHANLCCCSTGQREDEFGRSGDLIRRHLGMTPVHLSYPWGQYDRHVLAHLETSCAWQSAATIDRGFNDSGAERFRLRRDLIYPSWRKTQTWLRLGLGDCAPLYRLQRRLRYWLGALKTPGVHNPDRAIR